MRQSKVIKLFYIIIVLFGFIVANATDKNRDIIIQNTENIKIISQSIAKNYFYINQGIQISSAKRGLKRDIVNMDKSIKAIQKVAKAKNIKNLIEFALFSSEELKDILAQPYSTENGGLILDYTESLLESSDNMLKHSIPKDIDKETKMLLMVVDMKYLLARAAKYYIAFSAGFTDDVNVAQANIAVDEFGVSLKKVEEYKYPKSISKRVIRKLTRYWPSSQSFYRGIKKSELPTIIFISTKHMERSINKLIVYHQKQINKYK
ncbi:Nitric oxide-responding transcriptional regulator Dnr (Crp/Fnr family) [hydrothermal vent metagenome]|uniref:Nitric oxide-responding transcriptional regulator Dnr (Crp/Fnr family) n=1 Tax=hydrothermal vent metagenome TaxID=652676 RepID=A0A1W1C1S9_9ZZZZ